jgi:hypothetical protein
MPKLAVPTPKSLTIRGFSAETYAMLAHIASLQHRSVNSLIVYLLDDYVGTRGIESVLTAKSQRHAQKSILS